MAGTVEPWVVWLGAVPGALGLAGGVTAFWRSGVRAGRLEQRLANVVQDLQKVEQDVADMKKLGETVARIDERTMATATETTGIRGAMDRLVENLLQERRPFADAPSSRPRR